MEQGKVGGRRNTILLVLAGIAILVILGFGLKSLMGGSGAPQHKPPKISLLPNTPPPPPPPPKEEKKPEPPKEQKEVRVEQPQQKQEPPPDMTQKMDGPKGDAPSDFLAGKVTKEDYSNKPDSGKGGGTGTGAVTRSVMNPFNNYAGLLKSELQRVLSRRNELKRRQYRIEVHVWVGEDGSMKKYEMLGTTNDADTDQAIRDVLAGLPAFSEPPPPRMPQPVRLRIVTSGRA